ncbi:MAG: hypothetical protein MJB12_14760 [Firmicutes bacterium]|nr:hypothetical protein [Bacillota bacterium]
MPLLMIIIIAFHAIIILSSMIVNGYSKPIKHEKAPSIEEDTMTQFRYTSKQLGFIQIRLKRLMDM